MPALRRRPASLGAIRHAPMSGADEFGDMVSIRLGTDAPKNGTDDTGVGAECLADFFHPQDAPGGGAARYAPGRAADDDATDDDAGGALAGGYITMLRLLNRPMDRDYRLTDEVLGVGATGSVFTAVVRRTCRKVAVKTLEVVGLSEKQVKSLMLEFEIQSSVDHPNIARMLECRMSEECVHMIIERLEGGTFLQQMRLGAFSEARTAGVVFQLLEAVDYLHSMGIMHRDVKLENLVRERARSDKVKLIDFGLSCRWKEGMRPLTRVCGTPYYMAPEVLRKSYTRSADLYAVGVVAHELLTGEVPMVDFYSIQPLASSFLDDRSPKAQSFVHELLAEDSTRMTAFEALGHDWIQKAQSAATRTSWWRNARPSTQAVSRMVAVVRGAFGRCKPQGRVAPFTEVVPGQTATSRSSR